MARKMALTRAELIAAGIEIPGSSSAESFIPTGSTVPTNGIYLPNTNTVAVATNGVQRASFGTSEVVFNDGGENYDFRIESDTNANIFFVDASANAVGIGTSAPTVSLHVRNDTTTAYSPGTGPWTTALVQNLDTTTAYTPAISQWQARGSTTTTSVWYAGNAGLDNAYAQSAFVIGNRTGASSYAERLRIDGSGNVGIGTTSPATLLHLRATGTPILRIQDDDGTGQYSDFYNSSGQSIYNAVNGAGVRGAHIFLQAGSEGARIDTSGRLLVGTSSTSAFPILPYAPTTSYNSRLQVAGTATGTSGISVSNWATSVNNGGTFGFAKSVSNTVGTNGTALIANTRIGSITFSGDDSAKFVLGGAIEAFADAAWGVDDGPTRLVFSTTADGASSPSERLRITSAGRVGIGTSSPSYTLHLQDNSGPTLSIDRNDTFLNDGDFVGGLRFGNNDSSGTPPHGTGIKVIADETFGSTKVHFLSGNRTAWNDDIYALTIDVAGNVGIGTTSPQSPLDVTGSGNIGALSDLALRVYSANRSAFLDVGFDGLNASTNSSGLKFFLNNTERARIDSSGNVGIGTSTPGYAKLDIRATKNTNQIRLTDPAASFGSTYFRQYYGNSTNRGLQIFNDAQTTALFYRTDGRLFCPEAVIVSGNVGIGTIAPQKRLHVVSDSNDGIAAGASAIRAYSADSTAYFEANYDGINSTITSNPPAARIAFAVNSSEKARIDSSGRLLVGTSSAVGNGNVQVANSVRLQSGAGSTQGVLRIVKYTLSTTTETILTIDVPAANQFIVIEGTFSGSRHGVGSGGGSGRVAKKTFVISRRSNAFDVVLTNGLGPNDFEATTSNVGGSAPKNVMNPTIARAGTEAATDPQKVIITVDSGANGVNGVVTAVFDVLTMGPTADIY